MLVQQVALVPIDVPRPLTRIRLLWHQGATTELTVVRPHRMESVRTSPEVLAQIREAQTATVDNPIHPLNGQTLAVRRIVSAGRVRVLHAYHPDGGTIFLPGALQRPPPAWAGQRPGRPLLHRRR